MGSYVAAIMWASFHGGTGAIVASQSLRLKFWAPLVHILIECNWDRVESHFSAAASGRYLWAKADIQVEFNNMRANGTVKVTIEIDPTIPGAEKMQEDIDKKTDLVLTKFMDAAQKVIFEPPPMKVEPAQADSGGWPWGVGFALKYRRDEKHLNLRYEETREMAYLQDTTISSSLTGFIDEIRADPEAEKRYFTTLYLDDWDRKVTRTIKPIVNYPDPARQWVGEPVAMLGCQVGYPDVNGSLQWSGHMFQATDPPDAVFQPAMAKKNMADVANPPEGWQPDVTFVKRTVHFSEPPDEAQFPYARVFIEQEVVDLDPGSNGTPTNVINLEIRADSAGKLGVGPISLDVDLENTKQIVEISFQCLGNTLDGRERNVTKFQWLYADQTEPRFWSIYTGQLDFVPRFKYQVRVIIKGSLFSKGMEWTGPWVETNGNGPLMINVPTQEDEGVTVSRTYPTPTGTGTGTGVGAPPPTPSPGTPIPAPLPAGPPPPSRGSKGSRQDGGTRVYGYKTVPEVVGATKESRGDGPKDGAPSSRGVEAEPQPVIEGWTTEDPSKKKRRGMS